LGMNDLEAEVEAALQRRDKMSAWVSTYEQAYLHLIFDDPQSGLRLVPILERLVGLMLGLPEVPHFHYLSALLRLRRGSDTDRRQAARSLRRLRLWAEHAPFSHEHRVHLVEAETARLLGDNQTARKAYERSVARAREHGFPQDEALALE